jgi:dTDP-4-dehydrorhamnose reductase
VKVLVTGVKGQLGYDVMKCLAERKIEAVGADLEEFDITDKDQTRNFILECRPDAVIHCSAYTAVDKAEDNLDLCYKVNAEGSRNIASVCKEIDAKMVYISTDYVFPGMGDRAYEADDPKGPLSAYGRTKLDGELAVKELLTKYFIVRIAWVFGVNGRNFIKTMLNLGKTHDQITVVNDQIGSPTYTYDLSRLLVDMVETEKYGRYHATNEGLCSWYEFACEIFKQAGEINPIYKKISVVPVSYSEYPAKAKRPSNSRMSKEKLTESGFQRLPAWQDALSRYLKVIEV